MEGTQKLSCKYELYTAKPQKNIHFGSTQYTDNLRSEFKQKIYNLTTELVQIFDCCCQEMFIGRQIEIQND